MKMAYKFKCMLGFDIKTKTSGLDVKRTRFSSKWTLCISTFREVLPSATCQDSFRTYSLFLRILK